MRCFSITISPERMNHKQKQDEANESMIEREGKKEKRTEQAV